MDIKRRNSKGKTKAVENDVTLRNSGAVEGCALHLDSSSSSGDEDDESG